MKRLAFLPALLALLVAFTASADLQGDAKALSALIDPAKLSTLKERGDVAARSRASLSGTLCVERRSTCAQPFLFW